MQCLRLTIRQPSVAIWLPSRPKEKILIVGVDGAPDVVPSLKDKDSLIVASAAQDPYAMAGKVVEIGTNYER